MTPESIVTASATWDSMTDEQKVEWLSVFMGWPKDGYGDWKPLKNWNHWRQVEEKVIEDVHLLNAYAQNVLVCQGSYGIHELADVQTTFFSAALPTRAKALYLAYQSLYDKA